MIRLSWNRGKCPCVAASRTDGAPVRLRRHPVKSNRKQQERNGPRQDSAPAEMSKTDSQTAHSNKMLPAQYTNMSK
jgi:hypothetical protein